MREIDGELKSHKRNLSEELIDAILKLKSGRLLELCEEDFGGRTPEAFRLNVSNYMRSKKIHIKTKLAGGKLFIGLRDPLKIEQLESVVEQQDKTDIVIKDADGYIIDESGHEVVDLQEADRKKRELEEIRNSFSQNSTHDVTDNDSPWEAGRNIDYKTKSVKDESVKVADWEDARGIDYHEGETKHE